MKNRYQVKPCDDLGSLPDNRRDRSWDVVDMSTGSTVTNHTTRRAARHEAALLNAQAGCDCIKGSPS